MILKSLDFLTFRTGLAEVQGLRKDGSPDLRFRVARVPPGVLCMPPDAMTLIASGRAKEAAPPPPVQRLAEAVLAADTALGAAVAGLRAGVAVWHAEQDGAGRWRPVRAPGGQLRDPFDARFRDEDEAVALWATQPDAVPLFSVRTEHGIRRAYIWNPGFLLEIATEIYGQKG